MRPSESWKEHLWAMAAHEPPSFEDWTNRLKVYNDYIKALADYRKAAAEAVLKEAQAAGEWAKVKAMQVVIRQMVLELQRLNRQRARVAKEIKRITELARRARPLLSGRQLGAFASAWSAYQQFEQKALLESTTDLYSIPVPESARAASHFLDNRAPARPCEPLPKDVVTALGLAAWLRSMKYMARSGTPPHQSLAHLFRAINGVAQQEVKVMQEAIEQMRKGTYDAWKPSTIIGVPTKLRKTSVESSFVRRAAGS
jgi:hypothetical protein